MEPVILTELALAIRDGREHVIVVLRQKRNVPKIDRQVKFAQGLGKELVTPKQEYVSVPEVIQEMIAPYPQEDAHRGKTYVKELQDNFVVLVTKSVVEIHVVLKIKRVLLILQRLNIVVLKVTWDLGVKQQIMVKELVVKPKSKNVLQKDVVIKMMFAMMVIVVLEGVVRLVVRVVVNVVNILEKLLEV
jgi:hypothetical protein